MKFISHISSETIQIPLIGSVIPAGFPSPAMDYMEERIDIAKVLAPHPLATFFVEVEGDSMIKAGIPPKALLVVDKSLDAKSGDIVVAWLNGGFTVKFLKKTSTRCFLIPANEKYPTITITEEMEMVVWGVVTHIIIDTKNIRPCTL